MEEYFPEYITATKVITYDVERIREMLSIDPEFVPTMDDVISHIDDLIMVDFSCGCGRATDLGDIILRDDDGNEW